MATRRAFALVMLILWIVLPLWSEEVGELRSFDSDMTIRELAASEKIPVKRLVRGLGREVGEIDGPSLGRLGIDARKAAKAVTDYREGESKIVRGIMFVGILIVFISLVVVAFLISLLRHLHIFERREKSGSSSKRSVRSVVGTITSSGDLSDYSIAAVVAAIFLHEEEVEAENQLLLTWRRASSGLWKTGGSMPNAAYFAAKRGR